MSQKWTSVATQAVLAVCGIWFFIMSVGFNDGGTSVYAGAGYYPMLVSGLITLFSITGIISDIFGKGKANAKIIDLSHIKNVGLVAIAVAIIIAFWQFFDLFYIGAFVGMSMLLIYLNPNARTKKAILISLAIAVLMSVSTYVIFEFALQIHV